VEQGTVTVPPATVGDVATEQEVAFEVAHLTADIPPSEVSHCVAANRPIAGAGCVEAGAGDARLRTVTANKATTATDTLDRWKLVDTPIVPWLPGPNAYGAVVRYRLPLRVAQNRHSTQLQPDLGERWRRRTSRHGMRGASALGRGGWSPVRWRY
jgi:hypothetical protein